MNALDYYNNPEITSYIKSELGFIRNREDKEDCKQEIFAELYDFMPLDIPESRKLIKRVCEKFKRAVKDIGDNEIGLYEAKII